MKQFVHMVKDPLGIYARPAGQIAKLAKCYSDTAITLTCNGKTAKASSVFKIMGLGVERGCQVTVKTEGSNEDEAIIALSNFFQNSL